MKMWNDKTTPAPKFEFEIGDIAFMKSEATRGKMQPVKIIGVECLDTKNGQLLSYKIQNVIIEFKYEKLKRVSVLKKLIADATYTYNESALTSQDGASKKEAQNAAYQINSLSCRRSSKGYSKTSRRRTMGLPNFARAGRTFSFFSQEKRAPARARSSTQTIIPQ